MIELGLVDEWGAAVIEASARFDQGDLVARPPFFYAGRPLHGVWETTRSLRPEVHGDESIVIDLDPEDGPPYGVLTSQGCDIVDTSRKPWVQIAPVYPAAELVGAEARLPDIRRDAVPHLILLEPPELDGLWVADLRIEMPVEKSWLVGQEPIIGFASDEDRRRFGRRLSDRLDRPALPDAIHEFVVRPLRRILDRANATVRTELAASRVEFRLAVRTHPDETHECRLLVVGRRAAVPDAVRALAETWWNGLDVTDQRVTVLASRFSTAEELTMREYVTSVLLDGRFLGEDAA